MVQFIAVAAVGGLAWYAWSSLRRHLGEIEARENAAPPEIRGTLKKDPETGKYHADD